MKVAALFVRADSVYKTMPGVDCYDEKRDARTFAGDMPVVAHPPCKRWSSLNNLVLVRYPEKAAEFAHGNDGGLFDFALRTVRAHGGVLEHPAQSRAWRKFDLPAPAFNRWQRGVCGGWCIELDQAAFGHAKGLGMTEHPHDPCATHNGHRPVRFKCPACGGKWRPCAGGTVRLFDGLRRRVCWRHRSGVRA